MVMVRDFFCEPVTDMSKAPSLCWCHALGGTMHVAGDPGCVFPDGGAEIRVEFKRIQAIRVFEKSGRKYHPCYLKLIDALVKVLQKHPQASVDFVPTEMGRDYKQYSGRKDLCTMLAGDFDDRNGEGTYLEECWAVW